jgi:hypothetical protein
MEKFKIAASWETEERKVLLLGCFVLFVCSIQWMVSYFPGQRQTRHMKDRQDAGEGHSLPIDEVQSEFVQYVKQR